MYTGSDSNAPGVSVQYDYDPLGRLAEVRTTGRDGAMLAPVDEEPTSYFYDAITGHLARVEWPNGVIGINQFDVMGHPESIKYLEPDATPTDFTDNPVISEFVYTYYDNGALETAVETSGAVTATWSWQYDPLGRLIEEQRDASDDLLDFTTTYAYDLVGNRLSVATDSDADPAIDELILFSYDSNDRLTTETKTVEGVLATTTSYAYGPTDLTSKTVVDESTGQNVEVTTYAYNLQGRLETVDVDDYSGGIIVASTRTVYTYDHGGVRVRIDKLIDADASGTYETITHTQFLIDAQNFTGYSQVVEEIVTDDDPSPNVLERRTYAIGLDIETQATTDGGGTQVLNLHSDVKGSTRLVTDAAALVSDRFQFDAFGKALEFDPGSAPTRILYDGEQFDSATDGYYLRARYYNPASGRFNRLDPFGGIPGNPLSLNKYAFAHNDPINMSDPTGLFGLGAVFAVYRLLKIASVFRETLLGITTIANIHFQPKIRDNASLIIHGVHGPPIPTFSSPGWSRPFQNDLRNSGLRSNDFFEITWSGFDLVGFGVLPETATHLTALLFTMQSMRAAWSKGYDELNFISHSWGTILSYQAIDMTPVPIENWVTMGSPMGAEIWTPAGLRGEWTNFYSNSDPITWLNLYPPFSIPNPFNITRGPATQFPGATININVTNMAAQPGDSILQRLREQHTAYWSDTDVLNDITRLLQ